MQYKPNSLVSALCRSTGSKKLRKLSDQTTRLSLVQNLLTTKELPVFTGVALLGVNRTSIYYKGTVASEEEMNCREITNNLYRLMVLIGIVFIIAFMILRLIPILGLYDVHFGTKNYIFHVVWIVLSLFFTSKSVSFSRALNIFLIDIFRSCHI